uniref:Uncharacterized protein n=1 Tax=Glossina brevipalpis TaxID=37001 RepID=A0A1A9WDL5_9MUSC
MRFSPTIRSMASIMFVMDEMKKYIDFQTFHFHWADYLVFAAMILLSTGTGLFFAFYKKEKAIELGQQDNDSGEKRRKNDFDTSNMNEYLLGSRKLKIFPVSMSLVGSYVSGVTILGTVSEIYYFGTQYWMIVIPIIFMAIAVSKIYLPVFSVLRVNSSYEVLTQGIGILNKKIMEKCLRSLNVIFVEHVGISRIIDTEYNFESNGVLLLEVCVWFIPPAKGDQYNLYTQYGSNSLSLIVANKWTGLCPKTRQSYN